MTEDPSFAACWQITPHLRRNRSFKSWEIDAACFYYIAGDHARARNLLQGLFDRRMLPFRRLEYESRWGGLLFCLGTLRSTAESRKRGRWKVRENKERAEAARMVADGFGYTLD